MTRRDTKRYGDFEDLGSGRIAGLKYLFVKRSLDGVMEML